MGNEDFARFIDYTILKQYVDTSVVSAYCKQAIEYGFYSVCVNPCYVKFVSDKLKGTAVKVCTVIGFPLGANLPEVKAYETKLALRDGADEIDMVINVGALKEGNLKLVKDDILGVVKEAKGKVVKVIIETCFLDDNEKVLICNIAKECGASFIKTSTGFGTSGAKVSDVELIKSVVGDSMGIKASGGIRDANQVKELIKAGANRIGTSSIIDFTKIAVKPIS